jgi:hypothetical protein
MSDNAARACDRIATVCEDGNSGQLSVYGMSKYQETRDESHGKFICV